MIMRNIKIVFVAILLLVPVSAWSQVSFSAEAGFATYKMDQLKGLNDLQKQSLPFDVQTVDNFNPGIDIGTSAQVKVFSDVLLGICYQYNTTGSRIGLRDYSGYYTFDQIVNGHFLGIGPEWIIDELKEYRISFSIMTGVLLTRIKMKETLSLSGEREQSSEYFSAFSIPVYPALKVSVPFKDWLDGFLTLGYLIDTGGEVHLRSNSSAVLMNGDESVKTEWSGFRITAGLRFNLVPK